MYVEEAETGSKMAIKKQSKKKIAKPKNKNQNEKRSAKSPKSNPQTSKKKTTAKKQSSVKNNQTAQKTTSSKKKASAKKSSVKKTTTKKTSAKKASAKKATAKKTTAKKSSKTKSAISTKSKSASKSKTSSSKKKAARSKPTSNKKVSTKQTTKHGEPLSQNSKGQSKTPKREFPTTKWGPNSIISFEATEHLPPPELTSIAGGFVFYNDKLVLANIPGRGWEIIVGRIDVGESPEITFRRETYDQVGLELSHVKMIGVVRIEHKGPEPPNCPYPFPIGYGVQYIGIAKELTPFKGGAESLGRSLITPEGFKNHYYEWNEYYDAIFRYAYEVYQKLKKKLKL